MSFHEDTGDMDLGLFRPMYKIKKERRRKSPARHGALSSRQGSKLGMFRDVPACPAMKHA